MRHPMFAPLQDAFAAALLDPDQPVPSGRMAHSAIVPVKRFAVYRNNVVASLIKALRTRFPAVERIVGAEFFAGMARIYATRHPPRSRLLVRYGDDFADFIERFSPAAELRYLPDVARLEAARTRAYHAADVAPLAAEWLAALPPASLPSLRLILHRSAEVVRSRHPVVTIWAMNAGELPLAPIDEDAAEDALVVRPAFTVEVRNLPPGGAAFVLAIAQGATLGEAAEAATADDPRFELSSSLAGLLASGALAGLAPDNAQKGFVA
jgi:Putative DNA-binding domain